MDWARREFFAAAEADRITVPPAFSREGSVWDLCLRKENNSLHILFGLLAEGATGEFPNDHQVTSQKN
jgi:hypothetical protein